MKKALAVIILGLLWCNVGFAGCIEGNCSTGQGTRTWANGNKYVGRFINGKKHGQGTYTYANGDKYVGEFKDGKQHGQGTYTWADGRVEKGIWKNDELVEPN